MSFNHTYASALCRGFCSEKWRVQAFLNKASATCLRVFEAEQSKARDVGADWAHTRAQSHGGIGRLVVSPHSPYRTMGPDAGLGLPGGRGTFF